MSERAIPIDGRSYQVDGRAVARRAIPDSGLEHDYDATELVLSDDDVIDPWPDEQADNDVAATGSPLYKLDGINDNPAAVYDGVDDYHVGDHMPPGDNSVYTLAVVVNPDSTSDYQIIFGNDIDDGGSRRGTRVEIEDGDYRLLHGGVAGVATTAASTTPDILVASYDGSTAVLDVNDKEAGSDSVSYSSGSEEAAPIGARSDGRDTFGGAVGRVLWYSEHYDSDGRSEIHDGLASQFGL